MCSDRAAARRPARSGGNEAAPQFRHRFRLLRAPPPRPRARIAAAAIWLAAAAPGLHTGPPAAARASSEPPTTAALIESAGTRILLWEEIDESGTARTLYRVSLEGRPFSRALVAGRRIHLRYANFDPLSGEPPVPAELAADARQTRLHLVQFLTQPLEVYRRALAALGAEVLHSCADHAYVVRMSPDAARAVRTLPYVRWVGALHPAYRLDDALLRRILREEREPCRCWVQLVERGAAAQQRAAEAIVAAGGRVEALLPDGPRLLATLSPPQIARLAREDDVLFIDPWSPPEPDMDLARQIGGAAGRPELARFRGQGVRGEVLDTGLRETHVDFQDPPPLLHGGNRWAPEHGTAVYGCVFGSGRGDSKGTGMLPEREQGIFASIGALREYGGELSRFEHTRQLIDPAGEYRAVFQSNSWGTRETTDYTTTSAAIDDMLFQLDILVCQSMGNTGGSAARPEAWAKNIVAVGGLLHQDTLERDDDAWSGGASIGPASDGRVKPDLTHFFDAVYCPSASGDDLYDAAFSGTSASTPITAGHFGVLFQMWHERVFPGFGGGASVFDSRPHAATARALLINSAYRYPFAGADHDLARGHQGWGMADLHRLYSDRNNLLIVDESEAIGPLESRTYSLNVAGAVCELAVTLVYRDPPGNPGSSQHRINDLTLRVVDPNGLEYWGNYGLHDGNESLPGGGPNTVDTVENVFVTGPVAGRWRIEVLADEIVQDGYLQTPEMDAVFALVARFRCGADLDDDGDVDLFDLAALLAAFGRDQGGDLDADGDTDLADLAILMGSYGCGR